MHLGHQEQWLMADRCVRVLKRMTKCYNIHVEYLSSATCDILLILKAV